MSGIVDLDDLARQRKMADGATMIRVLAGRLGLPRKAGVQGEVEARIEHGRWLADCPYCGGAELVSRANAEFYCLSCGLAENDGHPMAVEFPARREAIESTLELRRPLNRNWAPGETLAGLRRENRAHGIKEV